MKKIFAITTAALLAVSTAACDNTGLSEEDNLSAEVSNMEAEHDAIINALAEENIVVENVTADSNAQ